MPVLPILASLLAGAAAAMATLTVVGLAAKFGPVAPRRTALDRLRPLLQATALPPGLERSWGSETVSRDLHFAGARLQVREFAALRWLLLWLGVLLAIGLGALRAWDIFGQFVAVLVLSCMYFGPAIGLRWQCDRRRMEIDLSLPDFLDRLALGLEAGLSFEVSLRRTTSDFRGLLGDLLRRVVRQIDRGHARSEALREMADASPSADLHAFVAAVQQSDRLGTSLARALRVQTALLRARRRRRAQEASRRLPILIVFPLVFFFLPALLIIYLAPPLLHLFLGR